MNLHGAARVAALVFLLVSSGCAAPPSPAEVRGKITVDGAPVEKGMVTFLTGDDPMKAPKVAIYSGRYSARRIPTGTVKVAISVPMVVGSKKDNPDDPNSPETPVTREGLPAKYSSPTETTLTVDVQSGLTEKDFDLKSQ
jgi:hypothetical protein